MAFQWLQMRIQEERDRRERRAKNEERLPAALDELYGHLSDCVQNFTENFGPHSAEIVREADRIKVTSRDKRGGQWHVVSEVEVISDLELPGFRVQRGDFLLEVEVGLLPSNSLYYRDRAQDLYLTMDDFTRRILDRTLFPALEEQ